MRIKLSGKASDSQDKDSMSVNQFNSQVLDSEATEILLDGFLCEYSISEIKKLIELVRNKCRIGCVVTIIEKDFGVILSDIAIGKEDLANVNDYLENCKGLKSLLTYETISKIISPHFLISAVNFNSEKSTVTIKAKRVK